MSERVFWLRNNENTHKKHIHLMNKIKNIISNFVQALHNSFVMFK